MWWVGAKVLEELMGEFRKEQMSHIILLLLLGYCYYIFPFENWEKNTTV